MRDDAVKIRLGVSGDDPSLEIADLTPEKRLIGAVLRQALRDAIGRRMADGVNIQDAMATGREWLHLGKPLEERELIDPAPFSFAWVAIHLDADPEKLRQEMERAVVELIASEKAGAALTRGQ